MSVRKHIQNAYDKVHAPEDVIERMKQELYQKDLHEDAEHEIYRVEEARRPEIGKYLLYIAAVFAVCIGGGLAWNSIQQNRVDFHPGQAVQTEITETVSPRERTVPDVTGMNAQAAQTVLEEAGYQVRLTFDVTDSDPDARRLLEGTVIRTYPEAGALLKTGVVVVYVQPAEETLESMDE